MKIDKAILIRSKTHGWWWVVDYKSGRRVRYQERTPKSVRNFLFSLDNFHRLCVDGLQAGVWWYGYE